MAGYGNDPEYSRHISGDESDIDSLVRTAIQDAISYVETDLGPERAMATEYYHAQPFGNEEEGRSQYVQSEVRDGILGVIPSVLRIVHGPEHTVEYVARRGETVPLAEQATDYVRWVYEEDNTGFLITHSVLKDGLLKRLGVATWGMDTHPEIKLKAFKGLTREQLLAILFSDNVRPYRLTETEDGLIDAELAYAVTSGRIWVEAVPTDDFFWNRDARSIKDATIVGYRSRRTRGALRKMGVSAEDLEEFGSATHNVSEEEVARRATNDTTVPNLGAENEKVVYVEAYMMLPMGEDGETSLRKVCTLGESYAIIKNDPVDEKPFAVFSPDPEPHAFLGGSYFDRLKDMQKLNSQLWRALLDSAAGAAFPRMAYVDGQVSVADIMNNAIGAPIRMRQPGMVQPFEVPFTGEKLMPILGMTREVIENRIGNKDGAGSLDMDALQSTGAEAVNAALTAATAQPELLARLFAEQFQKPLYRGLLKLACHPMAESRIVRLRGQYVEVAPALWDADMDVSVNVALGNSADKKMMALQAVIADQKETLATLGPENPIVSLPMFRNAKAKALALAGIKDVDNYYKPIPDDWQPPPPPPPQPSPDELWIQAEKQMAFEKGMKELAIKQDELRLKEAEMNQVRELKLLELELKRYEIDSRSRTDIVTTGMDNETREKVAEQKPIPEVE